MPSVSVVVPAKNEARNLEHVFGTIPVPRFVAALTTGAAKAGLSIQFILRERLAGRVAVSADAFAAPPEVL